MIQRTPPIADGNRFAAAGFVLGLLGLIFAVIPFIGLIALVLVIPGVVFAGIGLARALRHQAPRLTMAAAGLALSVIGFAVCLAWIAGIAHDMSTNAGKVETVLYQVTGTARDDTITYSTFGDSGRTTDQETVNALPWSKEVRITGALKGSSLVGKAGQNGGTVTCTVSVNGTQTRKSTASGPFAVAACNGF